MIETLLNLYLIEKTKRELHFKLAITFEDTTMQHPPVWLIAPALAAFVAAPAYAVQYLNIEQAQKQFFPQADSFASSPLELSSKQKAFVEKARLESLQ